MKAELLRHLRAVLCIALLGLLNACGQSGALVLPGAEPPAQTGDAQPSEADEDDDEDEEQAQR